LAQHLAGAGREVHLVAHRVWPSLAEAQGVVVHEVPRPLGSHLLGAPLLSRAASRVAERLGRGTRLLSNGGNTRWESATWIHYLHATYTLRESRQAFARVRRQPPGGVCFSPASERRSGVRQPSSE
jgi:hypothetical protein